MPKLIKSQYLVWLTVLAAGAVLAVAGALILADKLASSRASSHCGFGNHQAFTMVIADEQVTPRRLTAARCDRLTIKNLSSQARLMAFGPHERHQAYDGIQERYLLPGEAFSLTLDQIGTVSLHDHNDPRLQTRISIRP